MKNKEYCYLLISKDEQINFLRSEILISNKEKKILKEQQLEINYLNQKIKKYEAIISTFNNIKDNSKDFSIKENEGKNNSKSTNMMTKEPNSNYLTPVKDLQLYSSQSNTRANSIVKVENIKTNSQKNFKPKAATNFFNTTNLKKNPFQNLKK